MVNAFWQSLFRLEQERAVFVRRHATLEGDMLAMRVNTRKTIDESRDMIRRADEVLARDVLQPRPH